MMDIIFGSNGAGKSSLMNFYLNESAFDFERIRAGLNRLDALSYNLDIDIPKPKHLTFLNGQTNFKKDGFTKRENLIVDPYRVGIQSQAPEKVRLQFIPEFSTIGFDEAQTYWPSRDKENDTQNYQFCWFEKHRHNNLDVYFTTTRALLIDKRIRVLCSGTHIIDRKVKMDGWGRTRIIWTVNKINVGDIDSYVSASKKERSLYSVRQKIVCPYNIYNLYDSEGMKELFFKGFSEEQLVKIDSWREENGVV